MKIVLLSWAHFGYSLAGEVVMNPDGSGLLVKDAVALHGGIESIARMAKDPKDGQSEKLGININLPGNAVMGIIECDKEAWQKFLS